MTVRLLVPALLTLAAVAAPASAAPGRCVDRHPIGETCVEGTQVCFAPDFIPMVRQCWDIV